MTDAIAGMLYVMTEGENAGAYNICTEMGEASVLELAQTMAGQVKGNQFRWTLTGKQEKTIRQ